MMMMILRVHSQYSGSHIFIMIFSRMPKSYPKVGLQNAYIFPKIRHGDIQYYFSIFNTKVYFEDLPPDVLNGTPHEDLKVIVDCTYENIFWMIIRLVIEVKDATGDQKRFCSNGKSMTAIVKIISTFSCVITEHLEVNVDECIFLYDYNVPLRKW